MEDKLLHRFTADQMFFNDAVEQGFIDMMVPDAFGVDDQQRAVVSDAQTGGESPFDAQGIIVAPQVTQLACQEIVEFDRFSLRIAEAPTTDKEMACIGCLAWRITH